MSIEKLHHILLQVRCKESCYEPDQLLWSEANPAFGQCYITSLIVHDYFGGNIVKAKLANGIGHYRNRINGQDIDLTRSQFVNGEIIPEGVIVSRDTMECNGRYKLLKNKIENVLHP